MAAKQIKSKQRVADHGEVFIRFINFACEYAKSHTGKKFILEGIWTYLFFEDPSEFEDYAVFMKGTSLVRSKFRRVMREAENDVSEALERLLDFGVYAADTTLRDVNVDKWRKYFEKKPETVIKFEDNYFTNLAEKVMNETNNINECFVRGDADGIRNIMNRVEKSKKMDIPEKAIITEECKRALADLA